MYVVKIKWLLNVCLHNLLQEIEVLVLLLSVSVTVKVLGPT